MGEAYALQVGERASCFDCGIDFGRGGGVLADAGCRPWDANANYTCTSCLDPDVEVFDVQLDEGSDGTT